MSVASAADTIELADIARSFRRGWRTVAAFTLLGAIAAAAVILWARPKYAASTSLVVKAGGDAGVSALSRLSGAIGDAGGILGGAFKSPIETEVQILSSRALLGHVVDSLLLQGRVLSPRSTATNEILASVALQPAFAPKTFKFVKAEGGVYEVEGDASHSRIAPGGVAKLPVGSVTLRHDLTLPAFELELRDREDAITRIAKRIAIDKVGGEVVQIRYQGDDSLSAAGVPNSLVATYLTRRATTDRGVNQHRVEFLEAKSDSAAHELAAAERALRKQQEVSGVIDPQVVGKIELERAAQMRASVGDLQLEDGAIRQLIARVGDGTIQPRELAAYPTFLKSAGINELLSQLAQVETERFKLLESRTEKDPEVMALTLSARHLEGQLLPIARSYSASVAKQRTDLQRQLDSLQGAIAGLPAVAESGLRLQRDVLRLSQIYAAMQAQLVEARLAAIQEGGDVRTLDAAVVPRKPSFPEPVSTAAAGIGGGLVCGLVAALLLGMLGRWMQDPYQVEQSTGYPALRFDAGSPLFLGTELPQTVLVLPVDDRARAEPVARQIASTALARSLSASVLDLSNSDDSRRLLASSDSPVAGVAGVAGAALDVNATIERMQQENDLVVVQLPGIRSSATIAALRRTRPVVLVVPERRIDRAQLQSAVQTLRRLDVPCAGIVLSGNVERHGILAR